MEKMTDKELLARAAKIVGAEMTDYSDRTPDHWTIEHDDGIWREWNPLRDDGDALRLIVKMGLTTDSHLFDAVMERIKEETKTGCFIQEATRRAIVRIAAQN